MAGTTERMPYRATVASAAHESVSRLPVVALLDDIRSLYNVGAFFRTADAAGVERLYLTGITGYPPSRALSKTALGAEETVSWEHPTDSIKLIRKLRAGGYEIAAVETSIHAVDLFEWVPAFPVCIIFGNEIEGIRPELAALADTHVRIPMLGIKHSLNVATAGGVLVYELLRKYRVMARRQPPAALA